jgi:hypothetical protein
LRPQEPLLLHTAGGAQSLSVVHEFLHTAAPHWYGKQGDGFGVTHLPAPSHADTPVKVVEPAGHDDPWQVVPWAYSWQVPVPSHLPFVPQEPVPWSRHVAVGSTVPAGTLLQVPAEPGSAHDWHLPPQRELQQTPCEQKPVAHSASLEHNAGGTFNPHEFATQLFGDLHCRLVAQLLKHWVPLHV